MNKTLSTGWLHTSPDVAVFNGPSAETIARKCGVLDPLRDWVHTEVNKTGKKQRAVATYVQGQDLIGAVYWAGFPEPKDNGIVCCVGRCTKPEDMPIVLLKLSEFFSCAINQHPNPWTVN